MRQRTRAHLRAAEIAIDVARHEFDAAQFRVRYAGGEADDIESIPVRSPTAGVVLAVPDENEGVVRAGEPLLEIGNPTSLEVRASVLTTDAVRLDQGTPVRITGWGGNHGLQGRVRLVEPAAVTKISALGVEEQRTRVTVDITSPPAEWTRLGDGFRVDVEFVVWQGDDVARVPVGALFRQQENWMVFRMRDGKAYSLPVGIGHHGQHYAELLSGLEIGDVVVLYPDNEIVDGVRVKAR